MIIIARSTSVGCCLPRHCSAISRKSFSSSQQGDKSKSLIPDVSSPLSGNVNAKQLAFSEFHGRSSISGVVATVFGGSGFLGRYVVNRLGRIGSRIVVPYRRDGLEVRHLKLMGDLGQVRPVKYDVRDMDLLRKSMRGSNVVVNLMGRNFETRNFSFEDVHVNATKAIAVAAREEGVDNFIQMSILGADESSHSGLYASKARGEKAAREYYPDAVVLRPALYFGDEDDFIHRIAHHIKLSNTRWPLWFYNMDRRIQPVAIEDVADAVLQAVKYYPNCAGKTYELVGPDVVVQRELLDEIYEILGRNKNYFEVSRATMKHVLKFFRLTLFKPRVRQDELNQWDTDQLLQKSSDALGFSDLNLIPRALVGQRLFDLLIEHVKIEGQTAALENMPEPPVGYTGLRYD